MWPFRNKRHLKYDSVEAWIAAEGIPPINQISDPQQRDRVFTQLGELREHLWQRHVRGLPEAEQALLQSGQHPAQSHKFQADAIPYAEALRQHLLSSGVPVHSVTIGLYHMDRLVLSVRLAPKANLDRERPR